jgi:MerR family transcriptional regulator, light-induced transcriptional regulator
MPTPAATASATLREELLGALVKGDAALAELIALDAVTEDGMSVTELYVDVLAPVLEEIGHRWEGGALSVADEHLATGIAHNVMRLVGRAATRRPRRSRERVLLAAVGGEAHVVGLRMIADLAEGAGFDVHFLGAAVPVDSLGDIVAKHEPAIIGLSVTMAASAGELSTALEEIACSGHQVRGVLVGGAGVPPDFDGGPSVAVARDAREAMARIEELAA